MKRYRLVTDAGDSSWMETDEGHEITDSRIEFYPCSEADEVIAEKDQLIEVLREHLGEPPLDVQEMVIKKLDLVSRDALAARDKTIERLKELVKLGYKEGLSDGLENGLPYPDWETSDTKKQLDSILGRHSDPPATATSQEPVKICCLCGAEITRGPYNVSFVNQYAHISCPAVASEGEKG